MSMQKHTEIKEEEGGGEKREIETSDSWTPWEQEEGRR